MNINSNFFNKYVNLVNEDAEFIKTVNEFEGQNENNLTEKLNQLKLLLDRLPKCTEHLKDVTWTATVIDKYEDSEILNIACIGLTNLQIEISQLKKILTSDLQKQNWDKDETEKEIRSNISNSLELLTDLFKQNGVYETAVLTTHKALDVLNPEQPALEEKSESETSSLPISKRIDHPTHGSTIQKSKTKKFLADCTKSMIFTPGKYYNPIPSKVKSYCMPEQDNSKEARKQDIIDIFKGERVLTEPKPFLESGKIIVDAVGGHVCAPEGFSKDLPRSESFHFNGVCLFDKKNREMYNPNDLARLLYREFGREGANRLMYVCNQATFSYQLSQLILPLIFGEDPIWQKQLPDKMLNPKNASGMVFELTHDREANKIDLSMKLKWQLHSDEETTFTAFCVTKLKIQIPYDELTAKDYPIQNPFPNLQVTDVLSTLVINNPKEAQELFLKF